MRTALVFILTLILLGTALPVSAGINNDSTTVYIKQRVTFDPVDNATWCGDCNSIDYTTGSPWTINPGWVPGYIPPIMAPTAGSSIETGCLWDVDDYFEYNSSGNVLGPKTTLTITECQWYSVPVRWGHTGGILNYVVWRSSSPDLQIKYRWDWDAGSNTFILPPPVKDGTTWLYKTCLYASPPEGGTLIDVPGSHDGRAVHQLVTITITNPTSRKVGKTGGIIGSDKRDYSVWCNQRGIEA